MVVLIAYWLWPHHTEPNRAEPCCGSAATQPYRQELFGLAERYSSMVRSDRTPCNVTVTSSVFQIVASKTCFEIEVITDEKLKEFTIKALASLQSNGNVSEIGVNKSVTIKSSKSSSISKLFFKFLSKQ